MGTELPFCPNCGKQIEATNVSFCPYCGNALNLKKVAKDRWPNVEKLGPFRFEFNKVYSSLKFAGLGTTLWFALGLNFNKRSYPSFIAPRTEYARSVLGAIISLRKIGLKVQMNDSQIRIFYPDGETATIVNGDCPMLLKTIALFYLYNGKVVDFNPSRVHPNKERWFYLRSVDGKRVMELLGPPVMLDTRYIGCPICPVETFLWKIHDVPGIRDSVVVDVGAWVGDTALRFASLGASRVIAVEPIPQNYKAMLTNIDLNPQLRKRIVPINGAFGKDGEVEISEPSSAYGGNASVFEHGRLKVKVKSMSLKTLLGNAGLKEAHYLKMDARGAESLLLSTPDDLSSFKYLKIEYNSVAGKYSLREFIRVIEKVGFMVEIFGSEGGGGILVAERT